MKSGRSIFGQRLNSLGGKKPRFSPVRCNEGLPACRLHLLRFPVPSKIFHKPLKSSVGFKSRSGVSDRLQALIEIAWWPLRVVSDHNTQERQRRFRKFFRKLRVMQQMRDVVWMLTRLQPVPQFRQRFRESIQQSDGRGVLSCFDCGLLDSVRLLAEIGLKPFHQTIKPW